MFTLSSSRSLSVSNRALNPGIVTSKSENRWIPCAKANRMAPVQRRPTSSAASWNTALNGPSVRARLEMFATGWFGIAREGTVLGYNK